MPKRSREEENSNTDAELFQRAVSDVKRLPHNQAPASSRPAPSSLRLRKDSTADIENEDVGRFLRPGVQTTVLQKLRRGQFKIGATLDLHGYTSIEADGELRKFIAGAQARGIRAVRIVHGKGHGSEHGPVLKSKVDRWLRQSNAVLAFCYAQPQSGGSGATDVLLKISAPRK